jgi:hypothetical protein
MSADLVLAVAALAFWVFSLRVVPIAAGAAIEEGIGGDIVSVREALKVPFARGFSEINTTENKQRGCASQNLGSYLGSKGDIGLRLATREKYFTWGRAEKHIVSGGPFEVGPLRQLIGVACAEYEIFQVGRRAPAVFEIESNHNRLVGIHPLDAEVARENVRSIRVGEFNCCAPQRESEEGDKNGSDSGRGIAILVNDVNGAPSADSGSIDDRASEWWRIFFCFFAHGCGLVCLAGIKR